MHYVYVLQSDCDRGLYLGMSKDLRRRFLEHQRGESSSTKGRRPWKLIYYEAYLEEQDAEGREMFLKSGCGRRFLDKQLKYHFSRFPRRETELTEGFTWLGHEDITTTEIYLHVSMGANGMGVSSPLDGLGAAV